MQHLEITLNKSSRLPLSDKRKEIMMEVIIYLFITLFMYTAASKILTIDKFTSTLGKSPLIGSYNVIVGWAVPVVEILISLLLVVPAFRKWGLYASFGLMTFFTLYLAYMVLSGNELPCNCGGVISTMTWQQHIWFNLGFVLLAIAGLILHKKK